MEDRVPGGRRRRTSYGAWVLVVLAALGAAFLLGRAGSLPLPAPAPARADGDPLEEYDFTGTVAPRSYVHQSRHRVWRYGLWTVQRHVDLNPFEGSMWSLLGCTFERINVYFGTRPMWHSETTYRATCSARPYGPQHDRAPRFDLVEDTLTSEWDTAANDLLAVDYTESGGLTLHLSYWNGGASGGNSAQLIRLDGNRPEAASVEVLWSGRYETLADVDGDGEPEIVDSDWAHHYADYLPWKGIWGSVVLDWSKEKGRYVVANDRLYVQAMRQIASEERKPIWDPAHWMEARRDEVRNAVAEIGGAERPWGVETARQRALLALAQVLLDYLWTGHVAEARALLGETELEHFGGDEHGPRLTRAAWWAAFVEGCRRSDWWDELRVLFPALETLDDT